ncbi:MAG TPA: dethiobiotin synthase [Nitrospirae bacterium]|nr:dethiobiotin synthase [Nitrospirota bacterium]
MSKGIFITGTDTGIGKTFVAVGLIKAMRERGLNVCPMKPVETGCRIRDGEPVPEDALKLINASGINEPVDAINPYRLRHPLAPSVAAEIEGVKISGKKILSAYNKLSRKYDLVIIEGAGGIMAPVYKKYLFLDLAKDLDLPVVIVSRPGLGTINHSLLTIEAARHKGLNVFGVIINYAVKTKKGLPEKTAPEVIERLGGAPVLGVVPYTEKPGNSRLDKIFNRIASLLQKQTVSVYKL